MSFNPHENPHDACLSLVETLIGLKRPGFKWDQDLALFEFFDYALSQMQDPLRREAILSVSLRMKYQLTPADLLEEYARLLGRSEGEQSADTIARKQRENEFTERMHRAIEEQRRREFRPEMLDPDYRRRFLESRGSLGALVSATACASGSVRRALPPPPQTDFQRRLLACRTTDERKALLESAIADTNGVTE